MINLNELARKITLKEGGKKSLTIADVKEVMRLVLHEVANLKPAEVVDILEYYKKK